MSSLWSPAWRHRRGELDVATRVTIARTHRAGPRGEARTLKAACLVSCGLFVAEDAAIVAVRADLRHHLPRTVLAHLLIDAVLASLMVTYNYAASRFTISASSATNISEAMRRVAEERRETRSVPGHPLARIARRAGHALNPFNLIRTLADHLGRVADGVGERARRRGLSQTAHLLGELGVVNVLGVPGAALERAHRGSTLARRESFRHAVLFVASWFAGAWVIEKAVQQLHAIPLMGLIVADAFRTIGWAFANVTDITRPVGAVFVAVVVLGVIRYAKRVERMVHVLSA